MNVNIEIVFLDFLKKDFLDSRGLRFGRHYSSMGERCKLPQRKPKHIYVLLKVSLKSFKDVKFISKNELNSFLLACHKIDKQKTQINVNDGTRNYEREKL